MKTGLAFLVVLVLAPASPRAAEERDLEALFREGVALATAGKHAEALAKYEEILAVAPDATGVLYNAGLASYMLGKYEAALARWLRLKELDPGDWQVRAKLVQAYQALARPEARDREIEDLYRLRRETKVEGLRKRKFYCRDQFAVGDKKVFVFEHFELEGERAVRLRFTVNDAKGEKACVLSLGSYESTNQMMQDLGEIEEGQRGYHLDGYFPWGHATYRFFHGEPDYDKLRELVRGILAGEVQPLSSSRAAPDEEEER